MSEERKLKRIQYDANTVIYVLPHVDEKVVRKKFDARRDAASIPYLSLLQEQTRYKKKFQ